MYSTVQYGIVQYTYLAYTTYSITMFKYSGIISIRCCCTRTSIVRWNCAFNLLISNIALVKWVRTLGSMYSIINYFEEHQSKYFQLRFRLPSPLSDSWLRQAVECTAPQLRPERRVWHFSGIYFRKQSHSSSPCKVLMYCTRISVVFNPQAHETGDFRCVVLQRRERARVFENKRLWASDRFSSLPTTYRYSSRFFASDCPLERLMCWPLDSRAAAFDIDFDFLLRTAVELRIFERLQSSNSEWHSDSLIHR